MIWSQNHKMGFQPVIQFHGNRRGWPLSSATQIETRSIEYVPLAERHGKVWHLWPVWFAGDAHLATLATGVIGITLGLNLLWSAIAIVAGCVFGTFFMAFHSTQGPQLGLPQMIQSRPQFGYMGALLVWVVALVTYVGYNAFNQLLAGQTIHQLAGFEPHAAFIGFTVLALVLAVYGYDWIHRAQRWVAYLMIAALALFTVDAILHIRFAPEQLAAGGFRTTPFLTQFFAAAAYQLSWSIYVSDYSRYLPPKVGVLASFLWTYLGGFIGGAWMMLVGMIVAAVSPTLNIAAAVEAAGDRLFPGFGDLLLIASLGGLVTITAVNFYGASLTLLSVTDSLTGIRPTPAKRMVSLAAVGLLATAIALLSSDNMVAKFGDLLAVLLYLFTPWTAINLVDFYFVRKGHYSIRAIFDPNGMYGRWNWRGLLAYGVGFVAMIPFFSTGLYTGPVARVLGGADVAMLVGLPVSTIVYLLACRSMDFAADRRLAEAADYGLEADSV
jgi:NCS1 family nucleobase:cation symporter-1